MTTQVQRIEAAGWVSRTSDPNDARVALIDVTDAGRAVIDEVRLARRQVLAPIVDALTESELASVREATLVIERIIARSEEEGS